MRNILPIILIFTLAACAQPALVSNMTVHQIDVEHSKKLMGNVRLGTIAGGKETNPLWTSQVSFSDFKQSLENSLKSLSYYAEDEDEAKYIVDANLLNLSQPIFGTDFTVTSNVKYKVHHESNEKAKSIVGQGTATMGDNLIGVQRLKTANEKSIKNNITQFLEWLSENFK